MLDDTIQGNKFSDNSKSCYSWHTHWRIGQMDRRYFSTFAELFERIFKHSMSQAQWDWKYRQGRGQGIMAWRAESLIAHYGGLTRSINYFGKPEQACHLVDVMAEPTERGGLIRHSPFFLTATKFMETYVGYGRKHLIGYGFPTPRHIKLAVKLGLLTSGGKMAEVFWTPSHSGPSLGTQVRSLDDSKEFDKSVEILWQAMSVDLTEAIVGIRNSHWLRYRYLDHPDNDYKLFLISHRFTRKPYGIIVLRQDSRRCELLDVIAPLTNISLMIHHARRIAAHWQVDELFCWISTRYVSFFERCAGQQRELDLTIGIVVWTQGPNPDLVYDRWWLMSGDTDFR